MDSNFKTKHILFITSSRIGDAVLSTGLLKYMYEQHPEAKFTICCGGLAASLFEGFPALDKIIVINKRTYNRHWIKLWRQVIGTKFDIVVDLRNSAVSRLIRARRRYIFGNYIDKSKHKVEQNASVMKLNHTPEPKLWFTDKQKGRALELISDEDKKIKVLGIGPTSNWAGKTWPQERFIEIIDWLISKDGLMEGAKVAVFAAPGEEAAARNVLASVANEKQIDVIAKTDPASAAATIARCDYYIGNDSGLMHCAAAVGVPVLGLFGPSYPHIYAPWGVKANYVATPESFDELINFDGYSSKTVGSLMNSLTVDMVKEAIRQNWGK